MLKQLSIGSRLTLAFALLLCTTVVATTSREQSVGIEQTNKALQDLDRVTQQNAAAAHQLATTAGELSTHAGELQAAIAFFRVDDGPPPPAATVVIAKRPVPRRLAGHSPPTA